jgi:hypothetical protein
MSKTLVHALVGISLAMAIAICAFMVLDCAADPYLNATAACVKNASSRAGADACRAKLQDAGPEVSRATEAVSHGG